MSDTRTATPTAPGASPSEKVKAFIGDLARPLVILFVGVSGSLGIARICWAVAQSIEAGRATAEGGSIVIGAVGVVMSAIYAAKSLEVANIAKHEAQVKTAAVQAAAPSSTVTMTPPAELTITPTPPDDDTPPVRIEE